MGDEGDVDNHTAVDFLEFSLLALYAWEHRAICMILK